jgi:hypothetical protein
VEAVAYSRLRYLNKQRIRILEQDPLDRTDVGKLGLQCSGRDTKGMTANLNHSANETCPTSKED